MRATEVIELYIGDTVRLLPKSQRDDVANELRSLLNDELRARAEASGRPPDEALALSLVRNYGSPNEAAARYQVPWAIIDPADSTNFVRSAVIGIGGLIATSELIRREAGNAKTAEDMIKVGILAWLGVLVVVFGAKNWIRRHWPRTAMWAPIDRDRANRLGLAVLVPFTVCIIVLYAAPIWVLSHFLIGGFDTSVLTYTDHFRRTRLPFLIGLMVAMTVVMVVLAINGRRFRLIRRIDLGIQLALVGIMLKIASEGNVFEASGADAIARDIIALVAFMYVAVVGIELYKEVGRTTSGVGASGNRGYRSPPATAGTSDQ